MKKVTIYTTYYCPYCVRAKDLFDQLEIPYEAIDLGSDPDKRQEIIETYQFMTVPVIFFDDELIGGFDAVNELFMAGKLLEKLEVGGL